MKILFVEDNDGFAGDLGAALRTTDGVSVIDRVVDKATAAQKLPTLADAILDRVIHNAYRIDLAGESLRKRPSPS